MSENQQINLKDLSQEAAPAHRLFLLAGILSLLTFILLMGALACREATRQETVTWQYQVFDTQGTVSVSVPADGWVWDSTEEALGTADTLEVLKLLRTTADDGPRHAYITIYTVPLVLVP